MHSRNVRSHSPSPRTHIVLIAALFLAILLIFFLYKTDGPAPLSSQKASVNSRVPAAVTGTVDGARLRASTDPQRTPEQIVTAKVIQFGKHRREIVFDLAARHSEAIPDEVLRFFDAVEAGNWPETERLFELMAKRSGQYDNSPPGDPKL